MLSLIGSGQLVNRFSEIEDKVDEIMIKIDRLLRHFDLMDLVPDSRLEF